MRDIGKAASWWFAIPSVGPFVKQLTKGRSSILQMIKRAKHQELLQSELEARKLTASKLGMDYHLHDILGSELVRRYVSNMICSFDLYSTITTIHLQSLECIFVDRKYY